MMSPERFSLAPGCLFRPGLRVGVLLFALMNIVLAEGSPPIPDTPAGHAFGAWLDVLNSGDRTRSEAFLRTYKSWMTTESIADWSAGTGGYDLVEIPSSSRTNIFFRVKQRRWGVEEIGRMEVSASDPVALESLDVWRLPAGARFETNTLEAAA